MLPVFVDVTERAPTFRLSPLDTINTKKKHSWIQIWSPAKTLKQGWMMLLHRAFHGLNAFFYQEEFSKNIADPYLSKIALSSLIKAGQDQQNLYDLSFSQNNIKNNRPVEGDLGVMFLLSDERPNAGFKEWITLFTHANADLVLVSVTDKALSKSQMNTIKKLSPNTVFLSIRVLWKN